MLHLYHKDVQERCVAMGLTTYDKVKKNSVIFKIICIPGTEDLKPYINSHDKRVKWFSGTVGMALIAAVLAGVFSFL